MKRATNCFWRPTVCFFCAALTLLWLGGGRAAADRGSISLRPNIKLYEPNQRAIIAWNGRTEILLLSTDLRASAPTKVLEVLPLPAEPKVKKGSIRSFRIPPGDTFLMSNYTMRRTWDCRETTPGDKDRG